MADCHVPVAQDTTAQGVVHKPPVAVAPEVVFAESLDDPAQADELERQQDA